MTLKRIAILILFVALVATFTWANSPKNDLGAPDGATPANPSTTLGNPETGTQPSPAPTIKTYFSLFPAREIVRERVVVRQVPAPHPKTVLGHHAGSGHQGPYREIKSWNPASKSYVDAKVGKLGKEVRAELKSEAQTRASADEKISERGQPLEEKVNPILILGCVGLVMVAVVFAIGYTNQK